MPEKRKVTCPDCGQKDVEIYGDGSGICPTCDLNIQAVYERDRHERALKKIQEQPSPAPAPPTKVKKPFDFSM
jgi:uncharacterized Zn finger protein (UPF0148 family)